MYSGKACNINHRKNCIVKLSHQGQTLLYFICQIILCCAWYNALTNTQASEKKHVKNVQNVYPLQLNNDTFNEQTDLILGVL